MKTSIIINPFSGGGKTASMWAQIRDEVKGRLGSLEELSTSGPNDATRLATQVATQGNTELLIVGGGDGTINEVINGLFSENNEVINPNLKIGILSAGRGCDFIRSVGLPQEFREAVDILVAPAFKKVDVGCAFFKDEFGREIRRLFINIASAGLGGEVAKKANKVPRFVPPEITYFGTVAQSFVLSRPQFAKVVVDDKEVFDGPFLNLFIANGGYSGGGMCWAPMAKLDDGLFEVILVEPISKMNLILSAHKLYDGSFLNLPGISHYKGKTVVLRTADDIYLEMDGEQPGVAPALYTILPQALTLAVPS